MRRRKYSHRPISPLLRERCSLEISHSAVHDFVKRHCPESTDVLPHPHLVDNASTALRLCEHSCRIADEAEKRLAIWQLIAAMMLRAQLPAEDKPGYRSDPAQPLRLEDEEV
jgi:hypothetical protein